MLFKAAREQNCISQGTHGTPSYHEFKEGKGKCYHYKMLLKFENECVYGHRHKQIPNHREKGDFRRQTKSIEANSSPAFLLTLQNFLK